MIDRLAVPLPWLDRAGRLSWLKLAVFLACIAPALYFAAAFRLDTLGAKPITALIHATGEWAVRFLLFSLAISPLRRIADWGKVLVVRRMLGITVMAYAVAHLALYAVDQNLVLTKVASEIALRLYLTIGFVALIGLIALGLTSTDAAIRNLGPNWHGCTGSSTRSRCWPWSITSCSQDRRQRPGLLRRAVPAADGLARDAAVQAAGAAVVAAPPRDPRRPRHGRVRAAWYGLASGVPASLVLAANLDVSGPIRPAWWVLATGLLMPALALLRGARATGRTARPGGSGRDRVAAPRAAPARAAVSEPLSPSA